MSSRLIPLGSSCAMLMRSSQSLPRQSSRNLKPTCMHHQKMMVRHQYEEQQKNIGRSGSPKHRGHWRAKKHRFLQCFHVIVGAKCCPWVRTKSRRKFASRIFRCVFHEDLCQDLKPEWLRLQYHCSEKCLSRLYLSFENDFDPFIDQ